MRTLPQAVEAPTTPAATRRDWVLTSAAAALAIFIVITTIAVIRAAYSPLPFWDQWDEWLLYLRQLSYAHRLFLQHNEHRIAVARLFFALDHCWFQARDAFLLAANLGILASTALCMWGVARRAT